MSSKFQLIDLQHDRIKTSPKFEKTDWTKCALCQSDSSEILVCPADSKRKDKGAGYKTFSENILKFHEIGGLPLALDIQRLDEGPGIAETLLSNEAKWHKTCLLKFSSMRLERVSKRTMEDADTPCSSKKYTGQAGTSKINELCFFCDENTTSDTLHDASTFDLDSRARQCALKLQDERIIAKLSQSDMIATKAKYPLHYLVAFYNRAKALDAID